MTPQEIRLLELDIEMQKLNFEADLAYTREKFWGKIAYIQRSRWNVLYREFEELGGDAAVEKIHDART